MEREGRLTKDKRMRRTAYKGSLAFFAIMQSGWILGGQSETTNAALRCNVLDRLWKFPSRRRSSSDFESSPGHAHQTLSTLNWNYQTGGCQAKVHRLTTPPPHSRPVCRFVSHKLTDLQRNVRTCMSRNSSAGARDDRRRRCRAL